MLRSAASSLTSLLVLVAGRAVFFLLVSHLFGASVLGMVALSMSVIMLLALTLDLGAASSVVRLSAKEPSWVPGLRTNTYILAVLSLAAALPICLALYRFLGDSVFTDFGIVARVSLPFLIAAQVLQLGLQGIHFGRGDFLLVARGHLIHYGVLGLGTLGCRIAGLDGEVLLPLYLLALLLKAGFLAGKLDSGAGRLGSAERLRFLRLQIREGLHMMFGSLANLLNYRIDALLLAYFLPTEQVGFYAAAVTLAEVTLYLPKGIGQAAFPWVSSATRQPEDRVPRREIRKMALSLGATSAVLAAVLILVAPVAIPVIFGSSFEPAVAPARVLVVAAAFNGLGILAMSLLYGLGRADLNTAAGVLAAIANVVANLLLIPRLGIVGAAWASCVSYVLYFAITTLALRHVMDADRPAPARSQIDAEEKRRQSPTGRP